MESNNNNNKDKPANPWFDFSGENPWMEKEVVRFPKEAVKWHFPVFELEEVARRFPLAFESILHKMDCVSVLQLMCANKDMNSRVNEMMQKKVDPLNPFADVVVTIRGKAWKMGFKNVYFNSYRYNFEDDFCNKQDWRNNKKNDGNVPITNEEIVAGLRGFKPKEFYFDFEHYDDPSRYPWLTGNERMLNPGHGYQQKHEELLRKCKPAHGTKLSIKCGEHFGNILGILKPKDLTLTMPKVNLHRLFSKPNFKCVEYLRILRYRIDDYFIANEPVLKLVPTLYTQLVEFEFDGDIPSLPTYEIYDFIKVWVSGDGKLQKLRFTTAENDVDPVIYQTLQDIRSTTAKFDSLPAFMKKAISEDLDLIDIANENIAFRLILSPPKRQMACVFYSGSLASTAEPGKRRAHFGFHAFDYYPTR